jgi:hypothetical protein
MALRVARPVDGHAVAGHHDDSVPIDDEGAGDRTPVERETGLLAFAP